MDYVAKLDAELTPIREEAEQTKARYLSNRSAIEGDPLLSEEGRKQQIDELRASTRTNMSALRAQEDRKVKESISFLERLAFGSPASTLQQSDIIGFRDAQDRAERLEDSKDAAARLAIAERSRDKNLADAIVRVAVARGWTEVLKAHGAEHPETAGYLQAISDIQRFQANTWARTVAYAVL